MKVAEEYCWAITQAAGLSCCGRSGSRVLAIGFQLACHVYTYMVERMYCDFRVVEFLCFYTRRNRSSSMLYFRIASSNTIPTMILLLQCLDRISVSVKVVLEKLMVAQRATASVFCCLYTFKFRAIATRAHYRICSGIFS
jgi:hypothetical protein